MKRHHFDNCKKNPNYVPKEDKRPLLICPHCGKEGKNKKILLKYHFDNCKQNPNKFK
jgi:ssDNA-binding Zn-finger/Zn-ribbon topoisomerase 1